MKLLIGTDAHLFKTPDNKYWCDSVETYDFWMRYLNVFNEVRIVARVKYIKDIEQGYQRADGKGVEVWEIPFFQGPLQLIKEYARVNMALKGCYEGCNCALYRMPSQTAQMVLSFKPKEIPYAGEIVYCPRDDIVNQRTFFSKIINRIISMQLKSFCLKANGVSYVTEGMIQKYYPCYANLYGETDIFFTDSYSSINLKEDFYAKPRIKKDNKFVISISDAAMNTDRKGERTVIETVKLLRDRGYFVEAYIIGDGSKRKEFERFSENLGVKEFIHFKGRVSGSVAVREIIMQSDFYVLPTRGEGLPRGILEAMAVGLVVIATDVGGIAEVLSKEFLFEYNDSMGIANKVEELINDNSEREKICIRNYQKAMEFRYDLLQVKRNRFYKRLASLSVGDNGVIKVDGQGINSNT